MPYPHETSSYYELLEIDASATPEEIEAAYQRIIAYLSPQSLALYAMLDESETAEIRARVDAAYRVLSHPKKRAAYDREGAGAPSGNRWSDLVLEPDPQPEPQNPSPTLAQSQDPLAFESGVLSVPGPSHGLSEGALGTRELHQKPLRGEPARMGRHRLYPSMSLEIDADTEFSGSLLRRLRESAHAQLEDIAELTKITQRYLHALEENDFASLPAAVYVRGFVSEYARVLGLDSQKVAKSYMGLYRRYQQEGSLS